MNHTCRMTWTNNGRRYQARGVFAHVIDAALWVIRNVPGANGITAKTTGKGKAG